MEFALMLLLMLLLMYVLMIRPQQKRLREHQEAIAALKPGQRVLLTSGMYATLRHMGDRQAVVELAPGTEVTIVKPNIARAVTPEEEEFEFTDEPVTDSDETTPAPPVDPEVTRLEEQFRMDSAPETFDPRPSSDPDEPRKN